MLKKRRNRMVSQRNDRMDRCGIIARLINITIHLLAHPGATIKNIAERYGISERTVYRDLRNLHDAGIPIFTDDGYKIDQGFFLPLIRLNFGEICALFVAGLKLGHQRETMFHKEYLNAIDKIKVKLDSLSRSTLERMEETTYIHLPELNKISDAMSTEDFSRLNEAIQEKKRLLIRYFNRAQNKDEPIMIDPYGILYNVRIFSLGWHILAFCHKTKEIRAFNFIHINKMTPLDDSRFELPQNFSVKKYVIEVLDEAEKLCSKGFDLYSKNKCIEAVQFYKKALALYPACGDAHFFLGLSYRIIGNNKRALEEFKKALEYECADPEISYAHLSNCFLSMGEKDKAIEACKNAIKIKPEKTGYHIHLAEIYTNMGKYNEAIEEYQEVIKLKSNWEDIEDLKELKKAYQGLVGCYKKIDMMDKVNECNDILYDLTGEEKDLSEE